MDLDATTGGVTEMCFWLAFVFFFFSLVAKTCSKKKDRSRKDVVNFWLLCFVNVRNNDCIFAQYNASRDCEEELVMQR